VVFLICPAARFKGSVPLTSFFLFRAGLFKGQIESQLTRCRVIGLCFYLRCLSVDLGQLALRFIGRFCRVGALFRGGVLMERIYVADLSCAFYRPDFVAGLHGGFCDRFSLQKAVFFLAKDR
jgi:hypothetical protein